MKKVIFTPHALEKIRLLRKHGFELAPEMVARWVRKPEKIMRGYRGRLVAHKGLDEAHVLRIVYEDFEDAIVVVTLYPARRGRYEEGSL